MTLRRRRPGLVYPVNEDWHYVGEAGEPAFENSWVYSGAGPHPAFRMREAGIVDIQGSIKSGSSHAFTLPLAYRPAGNTSVTCLGLKSVSGTTLSLAADVAILTDGKVYPAVNVDGDTAPSYLYFGSAQFFLDPATAP